MAKPKNPNPDSILAAPFGNVPAVTPKQNEVALKGNTTTRYYGAPKSEKAEQQPAPLIINTHAKTEDEIAVQRFRQLQLLESSTALYDNKQDLTDLSIDQWAKAHPNEIGTQFDATDATDNAYAAFRRANPMDREITADYEARNYSSYIINPRDPSHAGRSRNGSIIDDGFKAPEFKLSKSEARTALSNDIKTVSQMYATEAGMSARDFAKVMSGIATIESSYGVIRSVKGTKYASSAGGAFHYLDRTIAGEVEQNMNDPRIASRVAKLGVTLNNGVAKSEAYTLKEDNILAGSILAKRIVDTVRKNPELKDDIEALATRVYQSHNLGDAGARALARGGRAALEATDHKADDNNPMFFRGASSDAEVNARYTKFVGNAIRSSETFVAAAFDGSEAALASAKPHDKKATKIAANLPEPALQPG